MGVLVASVRGDFVARVSGIDLSKPLDDGAFAQVRDAFNHYAVVVFPEQRISDDQQIAFSERFGPLEVSIRKDRPRRIENPRVSDISNVDERDRVFDPDDERTLYNTGNRLWHTDSSFKRVPHGLPPLGTRRSRPREARRNTVISAGPGTRCPPSASRDSKSWWPSTASSTRA